MTERVLFPSVRYHSTLPARVVYNPDEDDSLRAEDKAWRGFPYPPPVVIPPPPEPTAAELKALNAELVGKIADLTGKLKSAEETWLEMIVERDAALSQRDELAAQLPKLQADLDKVTKALAKKSKPAPAEANEPAEPKPAPAEANPPAENLDLERQPV